MSLAFFWDGQHAIGSEEIAMVRTKVRPVEKRPVAVVGPRLPYQVQGNNT
jgi:hypothetical protein